MTLEARKEYEIEMKELVSNCNSIQNDGYSTEIPIQHICIIDKQGHWSLGGKLVGNDVSYKKPAAAGSGC